MNELIQAILIVIACLFAAGLLVAITKTIIIVTNYEGQMRRDLLIYTWTGRLPE